jgi:hypothetical protein
MGIRYNLITANLNSGDNAVRVVYPDGFSRALNDGCVGFMNRAVWPPQRIVHDEITVNPDHARTDYVEFAELLKPCLSANESFLVWRVNIPFNLGVAWFENGEWWHHPEDQSNRFSGAWLLAIAKDGSLLQPRTTPQPFSGNENFDQIALLTPCLGRGSFNADMYLSGAYDVRHAVNLKNQWPKKATWPAQTTLSTERKAKGNLAIARLTGLFADRNAFVSHLRQAVDEHGWGRYNRTVLVTADGGSTARGDWAIVTMGKATPEEAFQLAAGVSGIPNPTVFSLVEGGSFAVGIVHNATIYDMSGIDNRTVGYYRGAQGLWCICFPIDVAESNLSIDPRQPPRPTFGEWDQGANKAVNPSGGSGGF